MLSEWDFDPLDLVEFPAQIWISRQSFRVFIPCSENMEIYLWI